MCDCAEGLLKIYRGQMPCVLTQGKRVVREGLRQIKQPCSEIHKGY